MFHVGQLVLCVDDRPHPRAKVTDSASFIRAGLKRGVVYTIRHCFVDPLGAHAVFLAEIVRAACPVPNTWNYVGELPFAAVRFRPLDDSRLEVFRSVLRDAPVDREPVEA